MIAIRGYSQTNSISGKIIINNSVNYNDCLINLIDSTSNKLINSVFSDSLGLFRFKNLKENEYIIHISHFGYNDTIINVDLTRKSHQHILINLNNSSYFLNEIKIIDKQPLTRKHGDTTIFNLDKISNKNELSTTEIFRKLPGIDNNESKFYYNGKEISKIFIDGVDVSDTDQKSLTDNVKFSSIKDIKLIDKYNTLNVTDIDSSQLGIAIFIESKPAAVNKLKLSTNSSFGFPYNYLIDGSTISIKKSTGFRVQISANNTNKSILAFEFEKFISNKTQEYLLENNKKSIFYKENDYFINDLQNEIKKRKEKVLKIIYSNKINEFVDIKSDLNFISAKTESRTSISENFNFGTMQSYKENQIALNNRFQINFANDVSFRIQKNTTGKIYIPMSLKFYTNRNSLDFTQTGRKINSRFNSYIDNYIVSPFYQFEFQKNKINIKFYGLFNYRNNISNSFLSSSDSTIFNRFSISQTNSLFQNVLLNEMNNENQISFTYSFKKLKLISLSGIRFQQNRIELLSYEKINNEFLGTENLNALDLFSSLHLVKEFKKIRVVFGANSFNNRFNFNKIFQNDLNGVNPYLLFLYKIGKKFNISSSYSNKFIQPNILQLTTKQIIKGPQFVETGTLGYQNVENRKIVTISIFKNFETGENILNFNASISKILPFRVILTNTISNNNLFINKFILGESKDNIIVFLNLDKRFDKINIGLRYNFDISDQYYNNINVKRVSHFLHFNTKYSIKQFSIKSTIKYNYTDVKIQSFRTITKMFDWASEINYDYKNTKHSIYFSTNRNFVNSQENIYNIISLNSVYKPFTKDYEIYINLSDILNLNSNQNISVVNLPESNSTRIFDVQPGNILIGLKWFL